MIASEATNNLNLYSVESEEALLGSILIAPGVLDDLRWLKSDDFYMVKHGWIYNAMQAIRARNEEVDQISLNDELREREQYEQVGGAAYLIHLVNQTPTHIHYYTYARIVESLARRRRLLAAATSIAQESIGQADKDKIRELLQIGETLLQSPDGQRSQLAQYLIHVAELENLPDLDWLMEGEIPTRGLVMFFGPSGVGKSFIALDKALSLSEIHPVVYIAAEGEYGFKTRVAAWCKHHHRDPKHLRLYFYMNVLSLINDAERGAFIMLLESIKPALIVVDTVAHCMLPGNENDTREMGLFVKGTKALQKKFDCATLLVHHTNKAGKIERGNLALRNACDVIARITDDDDLLVFECSKSKDTKPFDTRYMKLLPVMLDEEHAAPVVIDAEKVVQTATDPLTRNQQKVLDLLRMPAYAGGLSRGEICELAELSSGSAGRILSALIKFGYVTQENKRDGYTAVDSPYAQK